jgi:uncharacterized protein YbjT (DUF2867 family)
MSAVLVFGATGGVRRQAVAQLLGMGREVVAIACAK